MVVSVLFLSPVSYFKGGAERSLMDLMSNPHINPTLVVPASGPLKDRAEELGINCDVLSFGAIPEVTRPFKVGKGVTVVRDLFRAARQLNVIARKRGAALVHSNGLKAHAISVTARRLGGLPAVIHIRDIANTTSERMAWKALQLASDRTVLVSRACWPTAMLPANARVVYNGFSTSEIGSGHPSPVTGQLTIGFAGRIHPHKGLPVLIRALAQARGHGADLRLIVRGEFAPETPLHKDEVTALIQELGVGQFVKFEGFVSEASLVYKDVDVVCVPSVLPDPLPRSVMEAMGRGLVVVASRCGGIPEMISHGETGYLANSPEEIASSFMMLWQQPELRRDIGLRAHHKCLQTFTLDGLHRHITELYNELVVH